MQVPEAGVFVSPQSRGQEVVTVAVMTVFLVHATRVLSLKSKPMPAGLAKSLEAITAGVTTSKESVFTRVMTPETSMMKACPPSTSTVKALAWGFWEESSETITALTASPNLPTARRALRRASGEEMSMVAL
jgi:hypothetical protein